MLFRSVGNTPGDPSGTPLANFEVDGTDLIGVRDNTKLGQPFDPAPIDYNWDINRDEAVDGVDLILVRDNQVDFFSSLLVLNIAAPAPAPLAEGAPVLSALATFRTPATSSAAPPVGLATLDAAVVLESNSSTRRETPTASTEDSLLEKLARENRARSNAHSEDSADDALIDALLEDWSN